MAYDRIESKRNVRVFSVFAAPFALGLGVSLFFQPLVIDARSAESARHAETPAAEGATAPVGFDRDIPQIETRTQLRPTSPADSGSDSTLDFRLDPEIGIERDASRLLSELSHGRPSDPGYEAFPQPIPEPSTGLLVGAGLVALGVRRRYQRIGC